MSKIETGRFSERLRRSLGMKGQEVVAGELSPEVTAVIVLQDNSVEWQFLQSVRACVSVMKQGAVAGQNTIFRLRNPAGSGVLAVVDYMHFTSSTRANYNVGYGQTQAELGTPGTTAVRDIRWSDPANPTTLIASRANNVALSLFGSLWLSRTIADDTTTYALPFVLLPGQSVEWGTGSANVGIDSTVGWTERAFTQLEE